MPQSSFVGNPLYSHLLSIWWFWAT